jgi:hypothetical protein
VLVCTLPSRTRRGPSGNITSNAFRRARLEEQTGWNIDMIEQEQILPGSDEKIGLGCSHVVDLSHVHVTFLIHCGARKTVQIKGLKFEDL